PAASGARLCRKREGTCAMVDRRYILGGLGAVLGVALGSEAHAARKKRAAARKKPARKAAAKKAPTRSATPAPPSIPATTSPETLAALNGTFNQILNALLVWSPLTATGAGYDKDALAAQKH